MGVVQNELEKIDGFIISITKNPENDTYVFEIGLPKIWEYESNDIITIEKINESDEGVWLKLITDDESITIDEFIKFIEMIVDFNILIEEKRKQLDEELHQKKLEMEELLMKGMNEIEREKESAIKDFNKIKNNKSKPNVKSKDGLNEETNNQ